MAAATPAATTSEVAALHDRLSKYIFGHFHRKLTFEEARDTVSDALAEADRYTKAGNEIGALDRWLKRAAWRNALDLIRKNQGEGETPRQRPVDIDEVGTLASDEDHDDIAEADARAADARALERAWQSLKPDEQRALHLRYYDEQPVEQVLGVLDCSRHHYENLTKRGLRKLRQALVQAVGDDGCRACRALTLQALDQPVLPDAAAERDAHLESCLACRAFSHRHRGLIAALPLPAVGFIDRVLARVHGQLAGTPDLSQHGETLVGAAAVSGTAAAGGGTVLAGGGAALAGAGAAKMVAAACTAAAVTAGACLPALTRSPKPAPAKATQAKRALKRTPAPAAPPAQPAMVAPSDDPRPPRTPATSATPAAPSVESEKNAKPKAKTQRQQQGADASPFLPEAGSDPAPEPPAAAQPASATGSSPRATAAPTSAAAPAADTAPSSSFSDEFSP